VQLHIDLSMKKSNFLYKIFYIYYDGFRHMTVGKTLWAVILIKLFIIFFVLKLLFFPDFLKSKAGSGKEANYVSKELILRGVK
jgi:hypothetical protein